MELIAKTKMADGTESELYEPGGGAQEIYVEGIHGITARGPVVKFNWFVRSPNIIDAKAKPEVRYVAVRLVMGMDTFFTCADFLKENADNMRKQVKMSVEPIDKDGAKH